MNYSTPKPTVNMYSSSAMAAVQGMLTALHVDYQTCAPAYGVYTVQR